jgi:type III secretory pathway component EscT
MMAGTNGLALTLAAAGLGAARAVPVTWMAAPLGAGRLPAPLRIGLGLLLATLVAPALAARVASVGLDRAGPLLLAVVVAREAALGVSVGLVASCAFRAAEAAGWIADTLRGASVAEVLSPVADERTSPLGALYLMLACLVFLEIGGVPRLTEALAHSYEAVPIGGGGPLAGPDRAAAVVVVASARLIESGLGLAAPVVVAVWLTDLALALVARAAPQVPVYFLGLPLKGLVGLGVVLLGLGSLHGVLARGFAGWLSLVGRAITAWR